LEWFLLPFSVSPANTVSFLVLKEQILAKMQEFDVILQAAVNVRTELWSMIATLPDDTSFADNDSEHFTPSTFRLLQQLWIAPDRTLSKDDVRECVNEDEEASDEAVWTCLKRARQELKSIDFPYEIETLRGKGYRLVGTSGT